MIVINLNTEFFCKLVGVVACESLVALIEQNQNTSAVANEIFKNINLK